MADIIKEVMKELPDGSITFGAFEGANLVLYTKDKDFFDDNKGLIKNCVQMIKKRIELRFDPDLVLEPEKAEDVIKSLLPEECTADKIIFDTKRSVVYIETEKPGVAIGKGGSVLKDIRSQTCWVPVIRRTPPIRSQVVEDIRSVLYQNNDERRKFLDQVGHRIYDGWRRGSEKKNQWVRITYLGAARQVGRSCIFLQTPESRILMDCGIDLTKDDSEAYPYLEAPEFDINGLDAVLVTNANLDHSGFIPYLFKFGYTGPVYCTPPTLDLMVLLMLDMIKIARSEGREPLYTAEEIKKMVKNTIVIDFEEVTDITPDLRLTLYSAGYVLGSAMVHLHIGNGLHNMLYTGDMRYQRTIMLEPAHSQFQRIETLMIESVYGNKENVHPIRQEVEATLRDAIRNTLARNGKVLIPTPGAGKAQEVMVLLEEMARLKEIPEVPVFVEGMVWDVTAIHTVYPEYLSAQMRKVLFQKEQNPFLSPIFRCIESSKDRKQVLETETGCVIIATSGMLDSGPSAQYFKLLAENENNLLVLTCYQAEGTLGRRIQQGEREFPLNGSKRESLTLRMEVFHLPLTDHSDRKELMNYLARCSPRPKKIIINNGENSRSLDFASSVHKQFRVETITPRNLETLRLK